MRRSSIRGKEASMSLRLRAIAGRRTLARGLSACVLGALAALLCGIGRTHAQAPPPPPPSSYGPTAFDAVFSDAMTVHYTVDRACLANVASCIQYPSATSPCQLGQDINGLSCTVGINRFCAYKGHSSGWGVEKAGNPSQVEVTCVRSVAGEVRSVALSTLPGDCSSANPGRVCNAALDAYCRSQAFGARFGPLDPRPTLPSA